MSDDERAPLEQRVEAMDERLNQVEMVLARSILFLIISSACLVLTIKWYG